MYFYCYVYVFLLQCLCILIAMFMYSYCNVYVFLLLCMVYSPYSVSLCCSGYCLCVNVYCTTATGCEPDCRQEIYININMQLALTLQNCTSPSQNTNICRIILRINRIINLAVVTET